MNKPKILSIKEAKKSNLDKIAEIQNLYWDNEEERELAHDFEMEGDQEMVNDCLEKIDYQKERIKFLLSELDKKQVEVLMTEKVIYVDGEGGSNKIVVKS